LHQALTLEQPLRRRAWGIVLWRPQHCCVFTRDATSCDRPKHLAIIRYQRALGGVAATVQRLRELGWVDCRTVAIEYRWAEGRSERAAEIAVEFVRRKVDVIVTSGTGMVLAAKQATSVIPIVFAATGDPVGTGLVTSLARPGGNVTGLSNQQADLAAKRLELLREISAWGETGRHPGRAADQI
jgi:ABC transporter substrate binding protein